MGDFTRLGNIKEIDQYIYQNEDIFTWDHKKIYDVQYRLIRDAFSFHYENCMDYRKFCNIHNVCPEDINSYESLEKIPQIPSSVLKIKSILSVQKEKVVKKCTSSGTGGAISIVNRDEDTLNRFLGSVEETFDQMFSLDDALFLNLGPSTEEAKDLWFSYVMSITDMIFPTLNFVEDDIFYPDKVIENLLLFRNKYETIVLIGPPIMFLRLLEYMEANDIHITFGEKVYAITAGGWKKFTGQAIARKEFDGLLKEHFHGLKDECIRDAFNMVELNTVFSECERKIKHVPPWVKIIIRNPYDLKPVKNGDMGIISFLDPTATSYPSFILTSDFGKIVFDGECECGRKGTGIEIIRRVARGQARGCALKMDKKYNQEVNINRDV